MRSLLALLFCTVLSSTLHAQWDLQDSHTTAGLRGIHNVGGGVAWASGTNGTVLRTEDGGYLWQTCAVPPGAEKLDFRGIQAFDENTAIVMSSGKGDLSRLYKTTDGCRTWKLVFTNPDKDGFWDAIQFDRQLYGMIVGDPVDNQFSIWLSDDKGVHWKRGKDKGLKVDPAAQGAFAASNSSLALIKEGNWWAFGSGGKGGAFIYKIGEIAICVDCNDPPVSSWVKKSVPIGQVTESSGVFSLVAKQGLPFIAVGGDYRHPEDPNKTAAYSTDDGKTWSVAQTPPHGYRSAVAYDEKTKTWITVGPNGTDVSTDDGKNWRALKPKPSQPADADKNWNALSLPFVVGPNGRIGKLRDDALKP